MYVITLNSLWNPFDLLADGRNQHDCSAPVLIRISVDAPQVPSQRPTIITQLVLHSRYRLRHYQSGEELYWSYGKNFCEPRSYFKEAVSLTFCWKPIQITVTGQS